MRKKGFKGRCEKRVLSKSKEVCRTYDAIQYACADWLQNDDSVQEIRSNVPLEGSKYTALAETHISFHFLYRHMSPYRDTLRKSTDG